MRNGLPAYQFAMLCDGLKKKPKARTGTGGAARLAEFDWPARINKSLFDGSDISWRDE